MKPLAGGLTRAAFDQSRSHVLTYSVDQQKRGPGLVQLWDVKTGELIAQMPGTTDHVRQIALAPRADRLILVTDSGAPQLWDLPAQARRCDFVGHESTVTTVTFDSEGELLATAGADRTARIWDAQTCEESMVLRGHLHRVLTVEFDHSGQRLVTGGSEGECYVWDVRSQGAPAKRGADDARSSRDSHNGKWTLKHYVSATCTPNPLRSI